VLLLVMNQKGMERLEKDKLTLGTDASVAAGPVGRTASADTDISMRAEVVSYSRSHGVFAGLALDGAVLGRDDAEDRKFYGRGESKPSLGHSIRACRMSARRRRSEEVAAISRQ